uniref:Putative l1-5 dr n=2 Tax=Ixodes ricinus TaxID=34613 RepID=A0A090X973_IXORI
MNHVWMVTLHTEDAKRRLVAAKELKVKGLRCLVIDPSNSEVRVRVHWLPFHVPDEAVQRALAPYGKVNEVIRETWRAEGFLGVQSTTRVVRMTLKDGVAVDAMPHQLRFSGGNSLVVIPGRAPQCLRCKRTGHVRRECKVPKCTECHSFGHESKGCVKTYARATGPPADQETSDFLMEADEAESSAKETTVAATTSGVKTQETENNPIATVNSSDMAARQESPPEGDEERAAGGNQDESAGARPVGHPVDGEAEQAIINVAEAAMDATSQSTKRGLDQADALTDEDSQNDAPFQEVKKRTRANRARAATDERRRQDSK